jgi:N-acetylglucosaminyldiphosphoundecaprenol N-acetyl-beta-D-mannosaminyltransferase
MIEYLKKVYDRPKSELLKMLHQRLLRQQRTFLVTANPETLMHGSNSPEYHRLLMDEQTVIAPDGIGVVKMAQHAGRDVTERIAGVDIVQDLLRFGSEHGLSAFFYGSAQETVSRLDRVLRRQYPGLRVLGMKNGSDFSDDEVFSEIRAAEPDLVFVALGVPRQEILIYRHLGEFSKGVFAGVGGALDVISGAKRRAPRVFQDLNCEWLYRILTEPERLQRFWNNSVGFVLAAKKEIKKVSVKHDEKS